MSRILIVDDHPGFRRFARTLLESEGYDVVGVRPRAAPVAGFVHQDDLSGAALAAVVG